MENLQIPLSDTEEAIHSLLLENIRLKEYIKELENQLNELKGICDVEIQSDLSAQ